MPQQRNVSAVTKPACIIVATIDGMKSYGKGPFLSLTRAHTCGNYTGAFDASLAPYCSNVVRVIIVGDIIISDLTCL